MEKKVSPWKWECVEEIVASAEADQKRLDKIISLNRRRGVITIKAPEPYEIALDRIATPENLLGLVCDLTEKSWITTEIIHELVRKMSSFRSRTIRPV